MEMGRGWMQVGDESGTSMETKKTKARKSSFDSLAVRRCHRDNQPDQLLPRFLFQRVNHRRPTTAFPNCSPFHTSIALAPKPEPHSSSRQNGCIRILT